MNNPSSHFTPSSASEQKNTNRTRVRTTVFCILSIHVVGLMGLLMIGCRKPQTDETAVPPSDNTSAVAPHLDTPSNVDTSIPTNTYVAPEPETNAYVAPEPVQPVQPTVAGQSYTVIKGDTFASIAKKYPGVTAKQIQDANPTVVATKMKIGQKLEIPASSVNASTAPGAMTVNSATDRTYTVKSGDTLSSIASRHGTTVRALRAANNLITDKIRVGQKLNLPAKSSAMETPAPMPNQ